MARRFARRRFLGAAAAGAVLGSRSGQAQDAEGGSSREVRLEFLRPREIEEARAACPTIFQPLGTIEWHGVHNVVGVDAVKAHALCVRAAQKGGGVVSPALYGGVGGLNEPHTFIMDPEDRRLLPSPAAVAGAALPGDGPRRLPGDHHPHRPLRRGPADRRPRDRGSHEPGPGDSRARHAGVLAGAGRGLHGRPRRLGRDLADDAPVTPTPWTCRGSGTLPTRASAAATRRSPPPRMDAR